MVVMLYNCLLNINKKTKEYLTIIINYSEVMSPRFSLDYSWKILPGA